MIKLSTFDRIFRPRNIAIIGISPTAKTTFAMDLARWLQQAGFPKIFPVNPRYTELLGLKCYPSLSAICEEIEYSVVCVPASAVPGIINDCVLKGVRLATIFSSGFGESSNPDGKELEVRILETIRSSGMRLLGPNSTGFYSSGDRLVNGRNQNLEIGRVSFISQSGGNANEVIYRGQRRGLRFNKVINIGNALDIDESDLLEYLAEDFETDIVGIYMEGVKDGRKFKNTLRKAAGIKPVVIYKGGITTAGEKSVRGHTGSLAGKTNTFVTLCHQFGAIQTRCIDEMIDTLITLKAARGSLSGKGVGVLGVGGGPSVLASDELENAGLQLPNPGPLIAEQLSGLLPSIGGILTNPIDATNLLDPSVISIALQILEKMDTIQFLVYHLGFHPLSHWDVTGFNAESASSFVRILKKSSINKPLFLILKPPPHEGMDSFLEFQKAAAAAGLPVYYSFGDLGRALNHLISYRRSVAAI